MFLEHYGKQLNNIEKYRSYPRIVGETGGKDFIIAHKSANANEIINCSYKRSI